MSTSEDLRGVPDHELHGLSDASVMMLALSVLMGALGVEDDPLINELLRRARGNPVIR